VFELRRGGDGLWGAAWEDPQIHVAVSGDEAGPFPVLDGVLRDLVGRWPEVVAAIERFVRALPPEARVELEPPNRGAFGASDCGFDGTLHFQSLSVTEPGRASVTFYTGEPDGYATFRIVLVAGVPCELSAFAS